MHLFSRLLPGLFRMYMCMQSTIITAVASPLTSLAADAAPPAPLAPIVPRQLSQFADGNNIENIHVRLRLKFEHFEHEFSFTAMK